MKISFEEKKFIDSLSNLSGVNKEIIDKVFSAFVLYIVLELSSKVENYYEDNVLINEDITIRIPHIFKELTMSIKEKEDKGGISFDTLFKFVPSEVLLQNIHQVLNNEATEIQERIKLELYGGLKKISGQGV